MILPVEVERVKDAYFFRARGDHHSESFIVKYVNLSPNVQYIRPELWLSGDMPPMTKVIPLWPGDSLDWTIPARGIFGVECLNFDIDIFDVGSIKGTICIPSL